MKPTRQCLTTAQAARSSSKIHRYASYFQPCSRCLEMLSFVFDLLLLETVFDFKTNSIS